MQPVPLSPALNLEEANLLPPADNSKEENALITGGASGISLAIGTAYAENGAYVTLVDISEEARKRHVKDLQARGLKYVSNLSRQTSGRDTRRRKRSRRQSIHPAKTPDMVVAGASMFSETFIALEDEPHPISLDEDPLEPAAVAWETNAIGAASKAKLAQLYFDLPSGAPGDLASAEEPKSLLLVVGLGAYTSSKHGMRGLFRNIRPIFADHGHRMNLMAQWAILTPMTAKGIKMLDAVGAAVGNLDQAVMSALRCASDKDVNGRTLCIRPIRVLGLGDNLVSPNTGKAMHDLLTDDMAGWLGHAEINIGYYGVFFMNR